MKENGTPGVFANLKHVATDRMPMEATEGIEEKEGKGTLQK